MKKNKIYYGLAFIVLIFTNTQLNAQFFKSKIDTLKQIRALKISKTEKYSINGSSINILNIQDTKMTPMIYSGFGIGFNFGTYKIIKNHTYFTSLNLHYSALFGPDKISLSYMHGLKFRFNTGKLYQLNSKNWKIGASSNVETNSRIFIKNGNDPVSAEILSTINFAGSYSFDYKHYKLELRAELPLFAYAMRFPDYNVFGFNHLFMPIGRYNSIRTKFILVSPLKYNKHNKYSISYEWDLYSFTEYNKLFKLVSGAHFITFSYWLKKM